MRGRSSAAVGRDELRPEPARRSAAIAALPGRSARARIASVSTMPRAERGEQVRRLSLLPQPMPPVRPTREWHAQNSCR